MTKIEFLEVLRQSLAGEVSREVIEQNVRYYDQYISSQREGEDKVINDLGDPRLIAKTIIESDKAARKKGIYNGNQSSYSDYKEDDEEDNYKQEDVHAFHPFFKEIKWYHKLAIVLAIIVALIAIIYIGSIIFSFLFAFIVPIIIILMLVSLLRRR